MKRYFIAYIFAVFVALSVVNPAVSSVLTASDSLAYRQEWLKLLHYKKTIFGNYEGLIETPSFYISSQGRINPREELHETIKAFSSGSNEKCRFPARFNLLQKFGLVKGNMSDCEDYNQLLKDIKPAGITVLFTNAYMSNPASMFGHTLIRIDTTRKGTQMLAHASNFGANSGTDQGVIFALKGLFGGYVGKYNLNPYWNTINTYNNIENRDIWEYNLNLTDEEVMKFVNHLYELKDAEVQYYFLNKNCSYMLLELIEAVRSDLNITESYKYWAIPLDTLKTIKSVDGLVGDINYRPARYTKIMNMLNNMNENQYNAFLRGVKYNDFECSDLEEEEKPLVLEALYQYYQYEYVAKNIELKDYRHNSFAVLRKRSKMPQIQEPDISGQEPSLSHDSFQLSFSGGFYNERNYEQIGIKPAYTDLTDNSFGLIKGAEIKVLESKWRYYNQKHRLILQNFTPFEIISLVPSNIVFKPLSFETGIDIRHEYNPQNKDEGYAGFIQAGIGKTYDIFDCLWVYGLLKAQGEYGGFLPHNQWTAVTPKLGIYSEFGDFRFALSAEKRFATSTFGKRLISSGTLSYSISANTSIEAETVYSHNQKGHDQREFSLTAKYFFQ